MPAPRYRTIADLPTVIPVFPLTGVLLLPRARLPLNVFEPRYLSLVDDAMERYRLIGMIQPKEPGTDMAKKPALVNVGCVGRITEYGETDDGHYLITLTGIARFRIAGEREASTPYRQVAADYTAFAADLVPAADTPFARGRLLRALKPYLSERAMQTDWKALDEAPGETLVNALSMLCPFEPGEKQALIEAPGLKERAEALITLLEIATASTTAAGGKRSLN